MNTKTFWQPDSTDSIHKKTYELQTQHISHLLKNKMQAPHESNVSILQSEGPGWSGSTEDRYIPLWQSLAVQTSQPVLARRSFKPTFCEKTPDKTYISPYAHPKI